MATEKREVITLKGVISNGKSVAPFSTIKVGVTDAAIMVNANRAVYATTEGKAMVDDLKKSTGKPAKSSKADD